MNTKIKKALTFCLIALTTLLVILMVLPFAFKGKITTIASSKVNEMLNARVAFEDVNVSFLRSFPNVSVKLEKFKIVGKNEFAKDTLLQSEDIDLEINLKSLFSDNGYEVRRLQFNEPKVFAHVLPNGKANWNIMKEDSSSQVTDTSAMRFNLKLKDVRIKNADIIYLDEEGNMKAVVKGVNHHTSGDLTADSSLLVTETTADSVDFTMDGMKYLSGAQAEFNADIDANINKMIFRFGKNTSKINAIPFSIEGWFAMPDDGYDMDLKLHSEKVDFKSILSLVPVVYAKSFEDIKAGGDVSLSGFLRGKMTDLYYPSFDFKLSVGDGWFQYPSLPKAVKNINIQAQITNPGKTLDETVVDISRFSFLIGKNPFGASMRLATPMTDPDLQLKAVGKLNLSEIREIYPLESATQLNGLLDMNLQLDGRMSYYDKNEYDKFRFAGKLSIAGLLLKMTDLNQQVDIPQAILVFNNRYADLQNLKMKIGRNDITATGKLENFVAYALHNKTLGAVLSIQSNYFNADDFMSADQPTSSTDSTKLSVFVIPKNINFTMDASFKELVYDKMNFRNANGVLKVANGDMTFNKMNLQAFGGELIVNGLYATNDPKKPVVKMDVAINEVLFTEIFKQVHTFQKFAPIFEKATGKFSTKLTFNSLLKNDMMPDLATLIGGGSFSTKSMGVSNVPAITSLVSALNHKEFTTTTIRDLGLKFAIKDGRIITQPFNITLGDLKMKLGGATGLDKTIAYSGTVQLPDKLNLARNSSVNFTIGGTFMKPKVKVDLKSVMKSAADELKTKAVAEANKKIEPVKADLTKQAKEQAERIRATAKAAGDRLITEAQAQGEQLIAKTNNPIAKKLAEAAARKLIIEAQKRADALNAKAETEANDLINKAAEKAVFK